MWRMMLLLTSLTRRGGRAFVATPPRRCVSRVARGAAAESVDPLDVRRTALVAAIDADGNGALTWDEFVAGAQQVASDAARDGSSRSAAGAASAAVAKSASSRVPLQSIKLNLMLTISHLSRPPKRSLRSARAH